MSARSRDERFMTVALGLAAKARGRTSPNPMVGAVVVRRETIVGRGFHEQAGMEHAEVVALKDAGRHAHGAELFVNLEPCNHVGRTGPCVRAIVEAGIQRVVVGLRDPNPLVNGKGIRALRRVRVAVETGVMEAECRRLNEAFCCHIVKRRPFVTFKTATTLDGRVAARSGDSRWVSGEAARLEGHHLRDANDAIIVGVGTVLTDDPLLTCRGVRRGRDPLRVILDSHLRTPPTAKVVAATTTSLAPTWILTTADAPERRASTLERAGAKIFRLASVGRQVDVQAALRFLAKAEVMSVLLEGGPTLAGAFWRAGLVDRATVFVAPAILGDPEGLPVVMGPAVEDMAGATRLQGVEVKRLGVDLMISGRVMLEG